MAINRSVLEELNIPEVESNHDNFESAIAEIYLKKDKLKNLQLTVIPIITINWDGEILDF
jgi:hypothetical protein